MPAKKQYSNRPTVTISREVDQGLKSYMIKVYNYMFMGLLVTGLVSYGVSMSPELLVFLSGGFSWVLFIALIGIAFYMPSRINTMPSASAQMWYMLFSTLMGLSLSYIFILYTGTSIARVFFISAAMFGATSIYGYVTKRDLSKLGSLMVMALFGIIIASVVNIFLKSSGFSYIISLIAVVVFTGLIAYETQNIKEIYYEGDTAEVADKKAILGAFRLYLSLINLFTALLNLLGERR